MGKLDAVKSWLVVSAFVILAMAATIGKLKSDLAETRRTLETSQAGFNENAVNMARINKGLDDRVRRLNEAEQRASAIAQSP